MEILKSNEYSCNSKTKLKFTINNETVNDGQTVANAFISFYMWV